MGRWGSRVRPWLVLGAAMGVWLVVGCGGGGGGNGAASQAVSQMQVSGRVALPAGFPGGLNGLAVQADLDKQPVAADGSFRVKVLGPGAALLKLVNGAGKVVLLGYGDGGSGAASISADQTAQALLFFGVGGFTGPAAAWPQLRSIIAQSAEEKQVSALVTARIAADPTAIADGDTPLVQGVEQASATLLKNGRAGTRPGAVAPAVARAATVTVTGDPKGRDGSSTLLLVQPSGEQSGVEVLNNPSGSGIVFVNHLRRRCAAFIYETAVQQQGGDLTQLSSPKPVTFSQLGALSALGTVFGLNPPSQPAPSIEVQPANALHGVVGSITDVLQGAGAFTPATSPANGEIDLPQDGTAIKTVYSIFVLGPAFQQNNSLSAFPPFSQSAFFPFIKQWETTLTVLSWEEWILDIVVPILGSLNLPDGANFKGVSADTIQEIANALSNVPDLNASVANGDFKGATTSFIQTMVDNGTVRDEILKKIYSQFTPEITLQGQLVTASEDLKGALGVVATFDLILQAVDSSAVLVASSSQNPGEQWSGTVVQKNVRLNPPTATVNLATTTVQLTATPGLPGDPNAPFVYHWHVGGSAGGGIEDSVHTSGKDTGFDSVDSVITYAESSTATDKATDTVTVEAFVNAGTFSHPARGAALGQAQSVITVDLSQPCGGSFPQSIMSACGQVTVSPGTVRPGGQLSVTIQLHTGGACGNGASLSLNGAPISAATLNGAPATVNQGFIGLPGSPDGGFHTISYTATFTISGNAPDQCPTSTPSPGTNQIIPGFNGPWAIVNEGGGGNFDGWTSAVPFEIHS